MRKHTSKSSKLRELTCVVCGKKFENYISPAEIRAGKGKVCSPECKARYISLRLRRGEYRKCVRCGKMFWAKRSEDRRGYVRKYCSRECYIPTKRGEAISYDGYYVLNGIKIHRTMMEAHIGRKLKHDEIVHHINEDKLDNRLENFKIVSRAEHNQIHFGINDGLTNTQRFRLRRRQNGQNHKRETSRIRRHR